MFTDLTKIHQRIKNRLNVPVSDLELPIVTLSYAQSINGSITNSKKSASYISSKESLIWAHELRALHAAILIGIGTLLADNPQLTVRLAEGQNPQPVILDSRLRFPQNARLLHHPDCRPWIFTTNQASTRKQKELENLGALIYRLNADSWGRVNLIEVLQSLKVSGINTLMVEGGKKIITSFLSSKIVDQVAITIAPVIINGLKSVGCLRDVPPVFTDVEYTVAGNDLIFVADTRW